MPSGLVFEPREIPADPFIGHGLPGGKGITGQGQYQKGDEITAPDLFEEKGKALRGEEYQGQVDKSPEPDIYQIERDYGIGVT